MGSKWIQLLKECAPDISSVTAVYNPDSAPMTPLFFPPIESVKFSIPVQLNGAPVRNDVELEKTIMSAAERSNPGLIFLPDSYFASRIATVVPLVTQYKIPAIYSISAFARSGGLISLGIERADIFRRAAAYVDRILKGERPANLPIQMPNKFEMVLNLKAARSLGLVLPPTLLMQADEVIA